MRISICTGPLLPVPPIRGGSGTRVWYGLAGEFARRGHVVTVMSRAFTGQAETEERGGVFYRRFGGFNQSRAILWDLARDLGYAVRLLGRLPPADILVINDFWLPVLAAVVPRAGLRVLSVHRYPKRQFFLYRGVSRIAAPSTAIAQAIRRQAPSVAERVRVFPNAIDLSAFRPSESSPARDPALLFVGRLHPEKGLELLIAAFRLLSRRFGNAVLRLMGPHEPSQGGGGLTYLERLQSMAHGLQVEFLPPVFAVERLAETYRAADLFCYPSLAEYGEAFPVAPLEAMACGVVPVVSTLDCFRDLIEEGKSGFFFDHRGSDGANRLLLVLEQLLRLGELRETARRFAIERASGFGIDCVAQMYLDDFEALRAQS